MHTLGRDTPPWSPSTSKTTSEEISPTHLIGRTVLLGWARFMTASLIEFLDFTDYARIVKT